MYSRRKAARSTYIYIYTYEVIVKYIERKKESVKRKKGVRKRAWVGIERSEVK